MTVSAANSLLKTLEEPTSNTLLVLITSQPSALPATVRSRCQRIGVQRPTTEQALEWLRSHAPAAANPALLEFAGGAPLRAVEYADGRFDALDEDMQGGLAALLSGRTDVTQVAAAWAKDGLPDRLTWLDLWLSSVARGAIAGNADLITFPARGAHLPSLPRTLNISSVYSMVDRVRALKAQLARTALQRELALESWLIALLQSLESKSTPRANSQA
jgi:DNA polymerase-3 subunit delta'